MKAENIREILTEQEASKYFVAWERRELEFYRAMENIFKEKGQELNPQDFEEAVDFIRQINFAGWVDQRKLLESSGGEDSLEENASFREVFERCHDMGVEIGLARGKRTAFLICGLLLIFHICYQQIPW